MDITDDTKIRSWLCSFVTVLNIILFRWVFFGEARTSTSNKPRVVYFGYTLCVCFGWELALALPLLSLTVQTTAESCWCMIHVVDRLGCLSGREQAERLVPLTPQSGGLPTERLSFQKGFLAFLS